MAFHHGYLHLHCRWIEIVGTSVIVPSTQSYLGVWFTTGHWVFLFVLAADSLCRSQQNVGLKIHGDKYTEQDERLKNDGVCTGKVRGSRDIKLMSLCTLEWNCWVSSSQTIICHT